VITTRLRALASRCTSRKDAGLYGDAAKPFEAQLEVRDGVCFWSLREITDVNEAKITALLDDGLSIREVADETGIPKSTVGRTRKKLEALRGARGERITF
jgi:putative DNA primase/helicase